MITFEEAEAEHKRELARQDALDALENVDEFDSERHPEYGLNSIERTTLLNPRMSAKVIARLPSIRITKRKTVTQREPSFFMRAFSSRKLNRAADSDDDIFSDLSDQQAGGFSDKKAKKKKKKKKKKRILGDDDDDDDDDDEEEEEKEDAGAETLLPPMPKIGKPVNIDLLINRNSNAIKSLGILMDMVDEDVRLAVSAVQRIPVGEDFDRAAVTPEISSCIAQVRSSAGIHQRLDSNTISSQKALNYRRSGLIMMNSNYSHQLVRKLEPIYVNEARTITKFK